MRTSSGSEADTTGAVRTRTLVQVLRDAARGEPAALGELYTRFGSALYRLAYRLTGTRADAEDVVHDVFVGLPEALGRYEERGSFEPWLKRVTARRALMVLRSRRRRGETDLERASENGRADRPADAIAIEVALARLPPDLRAVLLLKEVEGYAHAEIGDMLGISKGASRITPAGRLDCWKIEARFRGRRMLVWVSKQPQWVVKLAQFHGDDAIWEQVLTSYSSVP